MVIFHGSANRTTFSTELDVDSVDRLRPRLEDATLTKAASKVHRGGLRPYFRLVNHQRLSNGYPDLSRFDYNLK